MSTSYLPANTDSLAQASEAKNPSEAIAILYRVLADPSSSSEAIRIKEQAIANLSDLLRQENRAEELTNLLTQLRPFFSLIPKAKTAKIVRGIVDSLAKIPGTSGLQISLCREIVQWTRAEKRTFLRQRIEAKLAALLLESKEYTEALSLLSELIKEVRRLDDKLLLVEIDLLENKLHFSLRNLPKAKAALTAARTVANAIYVPPAQQGTIDLRVVSSMLRRRIIRQLIATSMRHLKLLMRLKILRPYLASSTCCYAKSWLARLMMWLELYHHQRLACNIRAQNLMQ